MINLNIKNNIFTEYYCISHCPNCCYCRFISSNNRCYIGYRYEKHFWKVNREEYFLGGEWVE